MIGLDWLIRCSGKVGRKRCGHRVFPGRSFCYVCEKPYSLETIRILQKTVWNTSSREYSDTLLQLAASFQQQGGAAWVPFHDALIEAGLDEAAAHLRANHEDEGYKDGTCGTWCDLPKHILEAQDVMKFPIGECLPF